MGRKVLLIGIGRSGGETADLFLKKLNKDAVSACSIAIDTDETDLARLECAIPVPMVEKRSLSSVVEELGDESISDWFPCDWERDRTEFIKNLRMDQGSNQWRMKAMLSFMSYFSKSNNAEDFRSAIDGALKNDGSY